MISQPLLFFKTINPVLNHTTYLQGIPNYDNPTSTTFVPTADGIKFVDRKNANTYYFFLNRKDLIKVSVEDQSTIENRIGFKRLLLVGIFALAWKKKKTNPLSYLIFEYRNDVGLEDEIYFQTESKNGIQFFNNVRYNLYKYWQECDENPEGVSNIERDTVQQATAKITTDKKNNRNGCFFIIAAFVIIALFFKMCDGKGDSKTSAVNTSVDSVMIDSDNSSVITNKKLEKEKPINPKETKRQLAELNKIESAERKSYEETLHNAFLDNNLDIKVKVSGKNNKTIKLTYILFNDVWTRKFETEDYLKTIHSKGFNRIYITDGYDYTRYWTYED